jgi:CelD/BcsL family acetyltransferase involved in cellulose biosynthesis/predicted ATP-grasp superfamily ATP-dependent carboligase
MTPMTPLIALRSSPADDARADTGQDALSRLTDLSREFATDLTFSIHTQFDGIADEWRAFEEIAEGTAFQTFEWLTAWERHIGRRRGVTPVIVIGRFADGRTAFIAPLALERRWATRRLSWLGQELCDYNAPLLARDFAQRVAADRFVALWRELQQRLQADPASRYDWIEFEKMPQTVGVQTNPFTYLGVTANANSAHITQLGGDWETFYRAKRSSATRRRDRTKRKRIEEFGAIRFATAVEPDDLRRTLEVLWEQKKRIFAHKGIGDMFGRPGYREFFADFATNPQSRHMAHVSRLEIGERCGAANFALVFGDCYYHVLSSYYGGELTRFGPGTVHLRELLAFAIERGLRLFDFTIGDENYKLEWSDLRLKLYDYSTAARLRGWPWHGASMLRRRVKRFIKQTPVLWHGVSRLRSAVGQFIYPQAGPPPRAAGQAEPKPQSPPAPACVMGDMDLLKPIAAAGIPCSVVARPGAPSHYSRFTKARLRWDGAQTPERLVDALTQFGQAQGERPVLFYEEDEQLLFISRHREALARAFRFVIAEPSLVEDLADKGRFAALAKRHDLPVPAAVQFNPAQIGPGDVGVTFPIIIKPLTRLGRWNEALGLRKALSAANAETLRRMWPQLQALDTELLAQRLIRGGEAQIESYHCYVDARGAVAGEFTGRKLRTFPTRYGHTTALEITDAADVRRLGRVAVERLGLSGVAKLDFKRDAGGALHLLEINPRFTLWHHAGAVAGVNIPALVYADLTGTPRPYVSRAKAGVRWCRIWKDFPAAHQSGVPFATWLLWALRCEAKSSLSWNDPMPLIGAGLHAAFRARKGDARS